METLTIDKVIKKNWAGFMQATKDFFAKESKLTDFENRWKELRIFIVLLEDNKGFEKAQKSRNFLFSADINEELESKEDYEGYFKDFILTQEQKVNKPVGYSPVDHGNNFENPASMYNVIWIANYSDNTSEIAKILGSVVIQFLAEQTNDLNFITTEGCKRILGQIHDFNFIERYKNNVIEILGLQERILRNIASERYENREANSILCFVDDKDMQEPKKISSQNDPEIKGIVLFNEQCAKEYIITDEKLSAIRKMLETCNGTGGALLASIKPPFTLYGIIFFNGSNSFLKTHRYIQFLGKGNWKLYQNGQCFLMRKEEQYYVDDLYSGDALKNCLESINKIKDAEKFYNILLKLNEQQHGALMIIADDVKTEAERLGNMHRGMLIDQIDLGNHMEVLNGIAAIDGAVLVDWDGMCYGFGFILDGKVVMQGDVGRGARYNSAINYVKLTEADQIRYAVIVSEDKERGIEIINNEGRCIYGKSKVIQ